MVLWDTTSIHSWMAGNPMNIQDLPEKYRKQVTEQLYGKNNSNNSGVGSAESKRQSPVVCQHEAETSGMGAFGPQHRVRFIMYRCGTELDDDNERSAPKALRDGLSAAGLIRGDSKRDAIFECESVRVKTRKEVKTEIEITKLITKEKIA